jgi:tetratricopeptide (TPR) repeat protein
LLIQPEHAEAISGRNRALVYEQVRTLESESRRLLQSGNAVEAEKKLRQAEQLDGADQASQSSLAEVSAVVREEKLAASTKSGYQALGQRSYSDAVDYFDQALAIDPQSAAAREGKKQALAEYSVVLRQLNEEQAAAAIAQGRWALAISSAEKALRIDPAASAARASLERATLGQQIEASLDQILSAPSRLSDAGVYKEAQVVVQTARSSGDLGPQVPSKIESLETLLAKMATPQKIDIVSDGKTSVSVERVGSLGQIDKVSIELKPGRYVLRGSRPGYRDVRMEIDVTPNSPRNNYEIICNERIP